MTVRTPEWAYDNPQIEHPQAYAKAVKSKIMAGANAKLRGKIIKLLACRCCELYNWRCSQRIKEAKKQIKEFKNGRID